jgi:hypothetical protein
MKRWAFSCLLAALCGNAAALPQQADVPEPTQQPVHEPVRNPEMYREALRLLNEGRPDEANVLLQRFLEQEPEHAGAWLDLALSECELGNSAEAMRLFATIEERFDPPPGIREVIAARRADGCKGSHLRPASWLMSVSRGRSDNVNQGASSPTGSIGSGSSQTEFELDPSFLPKADNYVAASASFLRPLSGRGSLVFVQAYTQKYDSVKEQDVSSLLGALEHAWNLDNWRLRGTVAYGVTSLGGALYQRQQQAQLRVAAPLGLLLPKYLDFAMAANLNHVNYPTRASYDGDTWELSSTLTYRHQRNQVQLTVSGLKDNGASDRPGGDRRGGFANLQWYTSLSKGWYAEAGLSHQVWLGSQVYSPELIDVVRRQRTTTGRAAVQYYFLPNYSLYLEARATRNHENIGLFQYNVRSVQLGLRWDNF